MYHGPVLLAKIGREVTKGTEKIHNEGTKQTETTRRLPDIHLLTDASGSRAENAEDAEMKAGLARPRFAR